MVEEPYVNEQLAVEPSRGDVIARLSTSCRQLMLQPDRIDVREALAFVLGTGPLTFADCDSPLVIALVKEARAHAEELAFRLEAPGYSSLYIGATTARLHQTLAVLRLQLTLGVAQAYRQPSVA